MPIDSQRTATLSDEQRGVRKGQIAGMLLATAVFGVAVAFVPTSLTQESSLGERLAFVLKADVFVVFWLVHCIGLLGRHRFLSAEDIGGAGLTAASDRAKELQAILQNTLEQVVLAVVVHLLWAVVMPVAWINGAVAAAVLFTAGRFFFIRGYRGGASGRALGFVLTFYPTVLMLFAVIVTLVVTTAVSLTG